MAPGLALAMAGVACVDEGVRPPTLASDSDSADQVQFGMATRITTGGVLRSFIQADTAFMYQRSQSVEMHRFTAQFLDDNGNLKSTMTGDLGIYQTYSSKLDARGHVVVTTTDGQTLRTEHLIYDKQGNQIRSDTAFTYSSRTERGSGESFVSDIDFKNLEILRPRGFQRGRGFMLPAR